MARLTDLKTLNRIRRNVGNIIDTAGVQVTYKKFQSKDPGHPEFGMGDSLQYTFTPIRVIIVSPQLPQTQRDAGQIVEGSITINTQTKMSNQDEIIWDNFTYRADSEVTPIIIGGVTYYQCRLSRAN